MSLAQYVRPLVKMWWLIVAAVVVASIASFIVVRRSPPKYQSHTVLMVGRALENPNPSSGDLYLSQQLAGTYIDMVKREQIQNATMAALGLDWLPGYTARLVPGTQLMELAVIDTDPLRAQTVTNELANQLMLLTPANAEGVDRSRQAFVNQQLDELEASIKSTRDEIAKKQSELATMFSARQIADTQAQIAALQSKLAAAQASYASLIQSSQRNAINSITVVEPATLPTRPIGPNKYAMVVVAAAIGFVLAAAGAYLLDYMDDTLKNPADIQGALGLVTLGAVPKMNGPSGRGPLLTGSSRADHRIVQCLAHQSSVRRRRTASAIPYDHQFGTRRGQDIDGCEPQHRVGAGFTAGNSRGWRFAASSDPQASSPGQHPRRDNGATTGAF